MSGEHEDNKDVLHHRHGWSLTDSLNHKVNRSFDVRVHLVHHKSFDYDLKLVSPRANFTHRIDYEKKSLMEHHVRAFARVHSEAPRFDLLYHGLYYIYFLDFFLKNIVTF